jgi:hypothetical protein
MEMVHHTNLLFKIVEALAESPFFLFLCGCGLTILPFAGIMHIHRVPNSDGKNLH